MWLFATNKWRNEIQKKVPESSGLVWACPGLTRDLSATWLLEAAAAADFDSAYQAGCQRLRQKPTFRVVRGGRRPIEVCFHSEVCVFTQKSVILLGEAPGRCVFTRQMLIT